MQEFYIEVSSPVTIILTDKEHLNQSAHLLILPSKDKLGFRICVEDMGDHISIVDENNKTLEFGSE